MAKKQNTWKEQADRLERLKQEFAGFDREIAIEAINFFKESFDNQGFTDKTLVPWRRTKSGKDNRFGQKSQGILIQSGELKDSFDYSIANGVINIFNTASYAKTHNEGGTIKHPGGTPFFIKKGKLIFVSKRKVAVHKLKLPKTKPHNIKMPRRKFMGKSTVLNNRLAKLFINKIIKATYGKHI